MATYVNNLRLTELATGEGSGTWGTTTNTNLELIGEALGYGSEAIANASTHTITVADGTADSARSFYLKLTGGGQACTVTLAPNTLSKVWMVENTTNSTLTFSQGSGANVAVPAGQVKMIATDGAGSGAVVYDLLVDTDLTGTTTVVNLTSSGTIDAATVEFNSLSGTGSVAITDILDQDNMSSDSATALATQQSIKAYVDSSVASFDTLAEVLAQGNTTGSNDIDVDAAQKVQFRDSAIYINSSTDGQLDIVADTEIQLAATTIDINGAINASGEIIAASLDISGNIDVDGTTNLDVVDIDGAVDMASTLVVASSITSASSNIIAGTGTDAIQTMRIGSGSGGANKASINFQNSASSELFSLDFDNSTGTLDIRSDISGNIAQFGRSGGIVFNQDSNDYDFRVESNGNANMLFVDGGNNRVGVGTNAPSAPFHSSNTSSGITARFSNDVNQTLDIGTVSGTGANGSVYIDNANSGNIQLRTGNAERLNILASGNITIKTVDSFLYSPASSGGTYIDAGLKFESSNKKLEFWTADAERMSIASDGAATFNSSVTASQLAITSASTADTVTLTRGTNGQNNMLKFVTGSTDDWIVGERNDSSSDFRIFSYGANANVFSLARSSGAATFSSTIAAGAATFTTADNNAQLTLISTDADANAGPILVLDRQSASPADSDVLGQIQFNGKNDAAEAHGYAKIEARIVDASNATEDGRLELMTSVATEEGISRILMNATETVINDNSKDLDFRVESNGNSHMLFVDGGQNAVGINDSSPSGVRLTVLGVDTAAVAWGDTSKRGFLSFDTSGNPIVRAGSGLGLKFQSNSTRDVATFGTTETVFNEPGNDQDFRVESDSNTHMLFVDAGNNEIGINQSSPASTLHVTGRIQTDQFQYSGGDGSSTRIGRQVGWSQDNSSSSGSTWRKVGVFSLPDASFSSISLLVRTVYAGSNYGAYNASAQTFENQCNVTRKTTGVIDSADIFGANNPYLQLHRNSVSEWELQSRTVHDNQGVDIQVLILTSAGGAGFDVTNGISAGTTGGTVVSADGATAFTEYHTTIASYGGATFNEGGADVDFRVESDSNANMLFVDASTNRIGVGTSTPSYAVDIQAQESNNAIMRLLAGTNGSASIRLQNDAAHFDVNCQTNDNFAIYDQQNGRQPFTITAGSAALVVNEDSKDMDFRVESDGNTHMLFVGATNNEVLVGKSSGSTSASGIALNENSDIGQIVIVKTNSGTHNAIRFYHSGSETGNIQYSDTATAYNTSSDQRLKENIADADDSGELIDAIQVRKFDWKTDGSHQDYGMVAQELQTVAPEAVSAPENPDEMMSVDYSKLVPMLIKEIQSLRARVADLES